MPQSSWNHARPPSEACDGCPNPNPVAASPAVDVSGALLLVLGYLRLPEWLAFQGVSRLFRDSLSFAMSPRKHFLVWNHIPPSSELSPWFLMSVTPNPPLHVPGCMQLSADGVVRILKWHYELKGRLKILK
ncbi:hypothetical protein ZIOFF_065161 [Zingiber officinale]|uniref:Uncharacterized protein n=1 Tax=Zingiber officinale TaxID=94328 RepID=A0A8J5EX18_ZINOF|nr:hypothetical protein ZIOFF_065161 [Zingiber officinale]